VTPLEAAHAAQAGPAKSWTSEPAFMLHAGFGILSQRFIEKIRPYPKHRMLLQDDDRKIANVLSMFQWIVLLTV
jgi:hypothetical protein